MQHKRILIVSYYFAPQNLIGAVRPTKLAKYLARMGHEVTVICGTGLDGKTDPTLQRDLEELGDVHIIQEWNPLRRLKQQKAAAPAAAASAVSAVPAAPERAIPGWKKSLRGCVDAAYRYLRWQSEESFRRRAIRCLKKLGRTYDVVFSSYAPVGAHETARYAKRHGLAKRWIADFRDEVGLAFRWQEGRKVRFMRMLRREADVLCGVSRGILDVMDFPNGRVLPNGFDREDLPQVEPAPADGCLRLAYCGQFDMGRKGMGARDLTPAFRALASLVEEGLLSKEKLRLVYAGGEGALMRRYAASCGLEACVEDHGRVSRKESIALQKGAHILLLASWHTAQQPGILTGKLFEYMMMDKPILCCMNGELTQSAVKQVLDETGVGLCREEANAAQDDEKLLAYVRALVTRWQNGEELLQEQNAAAVEAYAYPQIARTLDSWMA